MGKDINILDTLLYNRSYDKDRISVVGSVAVQISTIHLLELVDVKPNSCFGYSLGQLTSAYYNRLLTLEETISCAFIINEAVLNDNRLHDVPPITV